MSHEALTMALSVAVPDWLYGTMAGWCILTAGIGIVVNSGVILLFALNKRLRTPFNYLLANLSGIELFIAMTGNTVLAVNCFQHVMVLSYTMCQLNAFGMTFLGEGSLEANTTTVPHQIVASLVL